MIISRPWFVSFPVAMQWYADAVPFIVFVSFSCSFLVERSEKMIWFFPFVTKSVYSSRHSVTYNECRLVAMKDVFCFKSWLLVASSLIFLEVVVNVFASVQTNAQSSSIYHGNDSTGIFPKTKIVLKNSSCSSWSSVLVCMHVGVLAIYLAVEINNYFELISNNNLLWLLRSSQWYGLEVETRLQSVSFWLVHSFTNVVWVDGSDLAFHHRQNGVVWAKMDDEKSSKHFHWLRGAKRGIGKSIQYYERM